MDEEFIPQEIIEHIASYSQLPRLSSVSKVSNQIESTLQKFRDESMEKDFPDWKYEDVTYMMNKLGSGSVDQFKYYVQNSVALWDYLQQFIPVDYAQMSAIQNHNIDLLVFLLHKYGTKNIVPLYNVAIHYDDIKIFMLLSEYAPIPQAVMQYIREMSPVILQYYIQNVPEIQLPEIFRLAIQQGKPDDILYLILDRFTTQQVLDSRRTMAFSPRASYLIGEELDKRIYY